MEDSDVGQSRLFGFITFADPSTVDKVIEDTHVINAGKHFSCVGCMLYCLLGINSRDLLLKFVYSPEIFNCDILSYLL